MICASYSESLATDLAEKCKAVMQADWYRATFPRTVLVGRAPTTNFRTTAGGGRYATSSGGTLTGCGGDVIIIDDPIKPDEAFSAAIRKTCLDWYANTVVSRLNNKKHGAIVLVMQRVHAEDLAGYVLQEGGWAHLNLPAIANSPDCIQIGRSSFYQRSIGVPLNPVHEDLAALQRQRRIMGTFPFSGQYQQAPIPAGGLMIRSKWLRRYDYAPVCQYGDRIVQSWDTAAGDRLTNDYSVCVTALVRGREVFVLDVYRARLQFPSLMAKACQLARRWKVDVLLIEEAVSGIQLIQSLRDPKNAEAAGIPHPIGRPTTTSKEARAWGQTARIEAGDLFLPKEALWLDEFRSELLGFPKSRHDDQVDALVHLLAWSAERQFERETIAGPEIVEVGDGPFYAEDDIDPWSGL